MGSQRENPVNPRLVLAAGSVSGRRTPLVATADSEQQGSEQQQVVVTGTRRAERTAADSSVPIDVVSSNDLQSTASVDLNNKLQAIVPSYTVRRLPLTDGAIYRAARSTARAVARPDARAGEQQATCIAPRSWT